MEKWEELLASLDPEYQANALRIPMASDLAPKANPDVPIQVPPPIAKTHSRTPAVVPQPEPSSREIVEPYVKKKFNLGEYSDDKRKAIVDKNNEYDFGGRASAALAALGAGFMGGNAAGAGQSVLARLDAEKKGRLDAFDKGRSNLVEQFNLDEAANKVALEDDKFARESDLGSDETKLAQMLAKKMVPGVDTSQMTARQINEKMPSLAKIYEIEQRRLETESRNADRRAMLGLKDNEGQKMLDKEYAKDYNDFTGGGNAKAVDAIQKLRDYEKEISEDDGLIQAGGGPISGSLPDAFRTQTSIARRDNIVSAANSALKATFGGQLSDGERKALANEFYNDKLSNAENLKIIQRKISELENGLASQKAKADYFKKGSTLKGFEAALPQSQAGGGFPRQVRNASGQVATVQNDQELQEARSEGFN